jgi:polyamine oxidase
VRTQRKGADGDVKTTYSAPFVLVTVPLGVLKRNSLFTPPLPPRHLASIERLGFGLLNKVVLFYRSAWWPTTTPTFFFLPNPDKHSGAQFAARDSSIMVQNMWLQNQTPALLIFLGGEVGEEAESENDADLKKWAEHTVWKYLSHTVTDSTMPRPTPKHIEITRWRSDPFAQGSYCYIPPAAASGSSTTSPSPLDILQLSRPVGERLFFAGEHTEADHYASVHAAWISGLREGRALETYLKARDGAMPSNVAFPDREMKN